VTERRTEEGKGGKGKGLRRERGGEESRGV